MRKFIVVVMLVSLTAPAFALTLPFFTPLKFHVENWDNGTLYFTENTKASYDENNMYVPDPSEPSGWKTIPGQGLHNMTVWNGVGSPPPLPYRILSPAGKNYIPDPSEDGWGIISVTGIRSKNDKVTYWQPSMTNTSITAVFYGLQDTFLHTEPGAVWPTQHIDSRAFGIEFYEQPGVDAWDPELGLDGRTALDLYTTVTTGTFLFKMDGHDNGLVHNVGPPYDGGATTEFHANFDSVGRTGLGYLFGDVDMSKMGALSKFFDNDGMYWNGSDKADFKLSWTAWPNEYHVGEAGGEWLVFSQDPMMTAGVPEPATLSLLGLGVLALLRHRRRAA